MANGEDVLSDEFYRNKLSDVSKARKPSPIWDLFSLESQPGMISMLAGKPDPATFPFDHITLGFKSPVQHPRHEVNSPQNTVEATLEGEDLVTALQYNMTAGLPELVKWVNTLMEEVHLKPHSSTSSSTPAGMSDGSWRVSLGPGSQDLLYKVFCALLNPGDTIIVEGPTYPTIIPLLDAMRCNYAIVESDEEGMSASSLESVLRTWTWAGDKPFPKVLYTVPFGSNPAGITTSLERRLEILHLARTYDLLIIEDDPYYFLYYGEKPRPPSYFALDLTLDFASTHRDAGRVRPRVVTESEEAMMGRGRVVRLDSFSKIVSAGLRLGWVTGPRVVVSAIEQHNASTVVQPSSLTQVVVLKLLQAWGLAGFLEHTQATAAFYKQRRDVMQGCLERHFERQTPSQHEGQQLQVDARQTGKPKAEWVVPDASMFFWIKLHLPPPATTTISSSSLDDTNPPTGLGEDLNAFVRTSAVPNGILVLPGTTAFPDERQTPCVRLAFSLATDAEMEEGVRRLASAVSGLWAQVDGPPPSPVGMIGPDAISEGGGIQREAGKRKSVRDSGVSLGGGSQSDGSVATVTATATTASATTTKERPLRPARPRSVMRKPLPPVPAIPLSPLPDPTPDVAPLKTKSSSPVLPPSAFSSDTESSDTLYLSGAQTKVPQQQHDDSYRALGGAELGRCRTTMGEWSSTSYGIEEVARESVRGHNGDDDEDGGVTVCVTPTPATAASPKGRGVLRRKSRGDMFGRGKPQRHEDTEEGGGGGVGTPPSSKLGRRLSRVASTLGFFRFSLLPSATPTKAREDLDDSDSSDSDDEDDNDNGRLVKHPTRLSPETQKPQQEQEQERKAKGALPGESAVRRGVVRLRASVVSLRGGTGRRVLKKLQRDINASKEKECAGKGEEEFLSEWRA